MGFSALIGKPPKVLTRTDATFNGSGSGTTKTYAGRDIGEAASDRLVIGVTSVGLLGVDRFVTAATIGGVAATVLAPVTDDSRPVCFFYAVVPSGTTATVVVTWNATASTDHLVLYSLTGWDSVTPAVYNSAKVATSLSLAAVPDEAAIVVGATQSTSGSVSFDPPVTDSGSVGGSGLARLSYGQVSESAGGTVNLSFTTAQVVVAVAWS